MKYSKAKYCGRTQGQTEIDLNGVGPTIRAEHHGIIEYRRLSFEHVGKHFQELKLCTLEDLKGVLIRPAHRRLWLLDLEHCT